MSPDRSACITQACLRDVLTSNDGAHLCQKSSKGLNLSLIGLSRPIGSRRSIEARPPNLPPDGGGCFVRLESSAFNLLSCGGSMRARPCLLLEPNETHLEKGTQSSRVPPTYFLGWIRAVFTYWFRCAARRWKLARRPGRRAKERRYPLSLAAQRQNSGRWAAQPCGIGSA
jgi:hypothetical protein